VIDLIRLTVVLTLISCGAALLIAVANAKTIDRRMQQETAAQQNALKSVMPEGVTVAEKKFKPGAGSDSLSYWLGISGNDTVYAFLVENRGYSSTIKYYVSTTGDGTILGMAVLDQSETPGLGSRVQEKLSKKYIWNGLFTPEEKTAPWFSEQFKGISINRPIVIEKTAGEWHSMDDPTRAELIGKNGITAITGSTISTRAVTTGLTEKAQKYLKAIRG
jgi:Na+-translocating ferredoxin:NAD+ oxidoreductase subunit G